MRVKTVNTLIRGVDRRQDQVESACGVAMDWVTRGFLNATLNGTWRLMYSLGDTSTVVTYSL